MYFLCYNTITEIGHSLANVNFLKKSTFTITWQINYNFGYFSPIHFDCTRIT